MRRVAFAVVACTGVAVVGAYAPAAVAADHLDSPAAKADPAADIADVYTFDDGANAVFAMTVFPAATTSAMFSDQVDYVFHTSSGAAFGKTTDDEDIICAFNTAQKIQCWVGTEDYVTGDASSASGLASADGKLKVFAGLRADPFFFNLEGFHNAEATVEGAASSLTFNAAGCPLLDNATAALLRTQLTTSTDGGAALDFFANLDALAIVVSVDKSLVTKGGPLVSVWGGTYQAK